MIFECASHKTYPANGSISDNRLESPFPLALVRWSNCDNPDRNLSQYVTILLDFLGYAGHHIVL